LHPLLARLAGGRRVCAHRGARSLAPENTLLALERAANLGADMAEIDVRLAADGGVLVIHDATFDRTTDAGRGTAVAATTVDAAAALDAGSWFLRDDPFGTVAAGLLDEAAQAAVRAQRVPALDQALALCLRRDLPLNIELKIEGPERDDLVRATLAAVDRASARGLVLVSSFDHDSLRALRRLAPELPVAALYEHGLPRPLAPLLQEMGAAACHPRADLVDAALIAELGAVGIATGPWTVNDRARFDQLVAAGAAWVCTDWPQRMLG
jgi:glycerophosphoryl diester phosphodiesterase